MKWLDFTVSPRGQWDHPGKPTAVPTDNGIITMEGVPYPVMGFVPGQPPIMMQPGGKYQFPGKMVYEIPMAYGGDISIPDLSRPNWLDKAQKGQQIKYYDDPKEFKKANQAYNDSLTVYNAPKTSYDRSTEISDAIDNGDFQKAKDLLAKPYPSYDAFRRLTILNHKSPQPVSGYPIYLGFNPSDPLVPKFKKPTEKPVYKEKPKEYIPTKTVKLEREPLQLIIPQSDRTLMPANNTLQVLHGIQEEDKSNQNLYPTRVVPAPDFRHGGWLDSYQGDKGSSQVSKSLVDPETGVVTNINITDEPPFQWTPLEDQYGIKPSAQKRSDYVPYKDVSGSPYETQDSYAHNYSTVDVPKNLSELPSYRLYAMGVSGNSYKPFSRDWTSGLNLNDAGYVKFDEKTGYNYQPSRQNLQDFQSLPMEGEKAFNLRRFVLNPYEGQPQTHDAYVKKDGTVDKENFIPTSYSREETMDNVFKDLYAQNLYKFKGDRDAAYNATSEFMTKRVEPQYKGKYYEYINNPNVSERDKLNINRVGSHMTVNPEQTEFSVQQTIADKLAEENPEYLTNEDLDFDKAIRADPRYREKLNEYNEVLQDWYVTNKNMSPEEAKALVEKDLYKNVPKRKTTYATFKTGGWLEQYQGDEGSSQVPANLSWIGNKGQVLTEQQQEEKLLDKKFGIGPTVDKAEAIKAKERLKKTKRIETPLPSGAITPVMGPVEYALMAPVAASTVSAAAPIIGSGLNASIAGIPGLTAGNALGAGFATDAIVNRLPQIPGQLSRGEYMDAAINAGTGVLDLFGAGMVSPLFKGAKKLPGSPNSGNVVDELREELQREGIVQSQKTLNLPWKNIIRKGVNPWTYDIPNKVDDIKSLIFSKIKNPAYTEPDEIERQYQMYKKFLVKPGEKVLSKDDYISQLDPDMFFRTRKEVVNNRFNTRFSENQTRGIKNRYTTWDMYLGKPQIENPMYDISHLTKSKDDVIYTIKEDFMDKPAIENRLAHVIGDIETGTAGTHRPVAKKTGDNKWIHLDNDSYFGGMGGFHWDIKKLPNGNYEAYANDVWDLQPFKGRDLPKSIRNIEAGKALGIGKPLNVKVGFEIDKDTKKILKTYGMAPGAVAGAAALKKEKNGGWLDNNQDYNYIKYKDLSLSRGTGWLDNYK